MVKWFLWMYHDMGSFIIQLEQIEGCDSLYLIIQHKIWFLCQIMTTFGFFRCCLVEIFVYVQILNQRIILWLHRCVTMFFVCQIELYLSWITRFDVSFKAFNFMLGWDWFVNTLDVKIGCFGAVSYTSESIRLFLVKLLLRISVVDLLIFVVFVRD